MPAPCAHRPIWTHIESRTRQPRSSVAYFALHRRVPLISALVRYGKTIEGAKLPLRWALPRSGASTAILSWRWLRSVPKRWFVHFYIVGVMWHPISCGIAVYNLRRYVEPLTMMCGGHGGDAGRMTRASQAGRAHRPRLRRQQPNKWTV